jgi:hypothetical protein
MEGGHVRTVGRTPRLILPEHNPTDPRSTTVGLRLTAQSEGANDASNAILDTTRHSYDRLPSL